LPCSVSFAFANFLLPHSPPSVNIYLLFGKWRTTDPLKKMMSELNVDFEADPKSLGKLTSRVFDARDIAAMAGRSVGWFYARRRELEGEGFPRRDDLLGGWHKSAVEQWFARRAGAASPSPSPAKQRLRRAIDARNDALRDMPR
jgi:predicted DNA-binding transcriptional regulator AlpA